MVINDSFMDFLNNQMKKKQKFMIYLPYNYISIYVNYRENNNQLYKTEYIVVYGLCVCVNKKNGNI